ncbi:hypothetical protein [Neorhizobium sp. JUb45]|uniref:hypothetical protein n=1 Tax=unclassified Neorhizobium TaxID=2629175 RepID=UPI0010E4488A|nr:hypothetical protein [Neorhizobium sp. JUb45]TCR00072.1 hypothetical protein EDF70_107149 [Neorhizobium sp. JUb45]
MTIRQALKKQSRLAAHPRGGEVPRWCNGSNAILAMMAALFAVVCFVEILWG